MAKKKYSPRFKKPDRKPKWMTTDNRRFGQLLKEWGYNKFKK